MPDAHFPHPLGNRVTDHSDNSNGCQRGGNDPEKHLHGPNETRGGGGIPHEIINRFDRFQHGIRLDHVGCFQDRLMQTAKGNRALDIHICKKGFQLLSMGEEYLPALFVGPIPFKRFAYTDNPDGVGESEPMPLVDLHILAKGRSPLKILFHKTPGHDGNRFRPRIHIPRIEIPTHHPADTKGPEIIGSHVELPCHGGLLNCDIGGMNINDAECRPARPCRDVSIRHGFHLGHGPDPVRDLLELPCKDRIVAGWVIIERKIDLRVQNVVGPESAVETGNLPHILDKQESDCQQKGAEGDLNDNDCLADSLEDTIPGGRPPPLFQQAGKRNLERHQHGAHTQGEDHKDGDRPRYQHHRNIHFHFPVQIPQNAPPGSAECGAQPGQQRFP